MKRTEKCPNCGAILYKYPQRCTFCGWPKPTEPAPPIKFDVELPPDPDWQKAIDIGQCPRCGEDQLRWNVVERRFHCGSCNKWFTDRGYHIPPIVGGSWPDDEDRKRFPEPHIPIPGTLQSIALTPVGMDNWTALLKFEIGTEVRRSRQEVASQGGLIIFGGLVFLVAGVVIGRAYSAIAGGALGAFGAIVAVAALATTVLVYRRIPFRKPVVTRKNLIDRISRGVFQNPSDVRNEYHQLWRVMTPSTPRSWYVSRMAKISWRLAQKTLRSRKILSSGSGLQTTKGDLKVGNTYVCMVCNNRSVSFNRFSGMYECNTLSCGAKGVELDRLSRM